MWGSGGSEHTRLSTLRPFARPAEKSGEHGDPGVALHGERAGGVRLRSRQPAAAGRVGGDGGAGGARAAAGDVEQGCDSAAASGKSYCCASPADEGV